MGANSGVALYLSIKAEFFDPTAQLSIIKLLGPKEKKVIVTVPRHVKFESSALPRASRSKNDTSGTSNETTISCLLRLTVSSMFRS